MPDRMVREGLLTSRRWCALKLHLQAFYVRLLLVADDYGTFPADPAVIRSRCYPLELDRAREADLQRWLDDLELAGLVRFHWHHSDRYLTLEKFKQAERMSHPRARYPRAETGGLPDASGQVLLPIAEQGPPGYSQASPPAVFFAPKAQKGREEKSPHSPPPAGGGNLNTPEARKPRRFRTAERKAGRIAEAREEIDRIKTEMQDLYYPGGCATKVLPTGAKAARADSLRARWDALEAEIEALENVNTPEKTGGVAA